VATAIRITGKVTEGERVFYAVRDSDVRVVPPKQIAINSVLIKRLKKKKNEPGFENTFGVRDYIFFSDDVNLFIGCNNIDTVVGYLGMLRYLGSSDSILYVKHTEQVEKVPESAIKAVTDEEFAEAISKKSYVVYPVKDISGDAEFEQINPYSCRPSGDVLERKYYLIEAKVKKGKNWKILEFC